MTLQQTVSNNPVYQTLIEQQAQQKFSEYLSQRFDLPKEFTDTKQYNPTTVYNAGDRVYLNAPAYLAANTYALGAVATVATGPLVNGNATGQVYVCTTAVAVPETFNPTHWALLGNQWDMFYAIYPFGVFDISHKFYNVGDGVWFKNHTYTALQKSVVLGQFEKFQFFTTNRIPFQNVFPDDPVNGLTFWKDNGAYTVPAGSISNTTFFIKGDNRNQSVLQHYIALVIYYLYRRIAPKNVPDERYAGYKEAMGWLTLAMKGEIVPGITQIQPPVGLKVRSGSQVKQQNSW